MYFNSKETDIQNKIASNSPEVRDLEEDSNQNDNNVRLPPVKTDKRPRTVAANRKLTGKKPLLASTKLVQDELPASSLEAESFEDGSNQDENDVRLPLVRVDKRPKTAANNGKPVNDKLLSVLTKLALGIKQDVRAKKILTLKTG